ncbi:hypothetical protein C8Q75DRAFT_801779 [Abortiporus biennis]|nr:hypothetical protein C8Q75DRAFT_801779 [Abortiporus biennis]
MRSAVRSFSRTIPRGVPATPQEPQATRPVYFVPRNSRGALPVYTDIRNSNRYLTLIRNVEGSVDALVADIKRSLYPSGTPEAERLKIQTVRSRHIVLSPGNFKHDVVQWLQQKGF